MKRFFTFKNIFLGCIVFLALFLRVYKIHSIPPALSWDEVSIGYNAYSILKTGRDEHGRIFPLDTFVAYGDYKPPLPIYLTIPFVAIFGLNELSVRLPSAIAGTLTVLLMYLLVTEVLIGKKQSTLVGITSSLALSISPWHLQLSRAGFEANIGTLFIVLGVWLMFVSRRLPHVLSLSALPFIASIYTFNSTRYVAPLVALGALFCIRKEIVRFPKSILYASVLAIILLLPIFPHLVSKQARLRFVEVNIFSDPSIVQMSNARGQIDGNTVFSKVIHNRRVGYVRSYLVHFFENLEPRFLFIRGDGNPKFSIQEVGQFYIVDILLLILGIYCLFTQVSWLGWFLLFWLLVSIAPAAMARETPHALRIENSLPVFILLISFGLSVLWQKTEKNRSVKFLLVCICAGYIFNVTYYIHNYYVHYPIEYSGEWQYGYREAILYAKTHKNEYDSIYLTESIGRAYMYALFYERYDPQQFWKTAKTSFDAAGFYHVFSFDTYTFVDDGIKDYTPRSLYILDPSEVPREATILKTVRLLNGSPILVLFTV